MHMTVDAEKYIKDALAKARTCWQVEDALQEIKKKRSLLSNGSVRRLRMYGYNRLREEARREHPTEGESESTTHP